MTHWILSGGYYVYVHRKATTGEVFYVGKGKENRAWQIHDRNPFWMNVYKKYGRKVEIVERFMQEWWALEMEVDLIAYYGRENLTNLTDGGEGWSGKKHSQQTKDKIRLLKIGTKWIEGQKEKRKESMMGYRHSEKTKKKIGDSQRGLPRPQGVGKKISEANKGRKTSEETRKKISDALKGRKAHINTIEGTKKRWTGAKHKPESIEKMKKSQKGRIVSDETRKKMSELRKGKKRSPESVKKTADAHRGMTRSEEFKEKMRGIARNRPPPSEETRRKQADATRARHEANRQKKLLESMQKDVVK